MKKGKLFKISLFGYRKKDVFQYIEEINRKTISLSEIEAGYNKKLKEYEKRAIAAEEKLSPVSSENERLQAELGDIKAALEAEKAEKEAAKAEAEAAKLQLDSVSAELTECKAELAEKSAELEKLKAAQAPFSGIYEKARLFDRLAKKYPKLDNLKKS